ncbi:MAG: WG repeat-containing protein [Candidatus Obscuribacter sp.]|nr:WG repeat-containing protein [Candidatus Obscuribacter sp.]MBK9276625.1 WG repeat-containing protein [Candidatus Obscuribacter sp.]MBL8083605.1 WG repeat-containing protein [Candidatus Obscuribacter sp.]HND37345.1 WG repeat-containing protein [Nitrosomonas sp.]
MIVSFFLHKSHGIYTSGKQSLSLAAFVLVFTSTFCFAETGLCKSTEAALGQTIELTERSVKPSCLPNRDFTRLGIMDLAGKATLLPHCRVIGRNAHGWIAVRMLNPERAVRKLIGPHGQIIPKTNNYEIVNYLTEKRAPVRVFPRTYDKNGMENLAFSYCTETGDILAARFDQVSAFSNGVAAVRRGRLVGFVGLDGKYLANSKLVECEFKDQLSQGCLAACVNGRWGYLDTGGNWIIKPQFDRAEPFRNDFALVVLANSGSAVEKSNCVSYVDKTGRIFDQRFHCGESFEEGYAAVSVVSMAQPSTRLWGLIDGRGEWVLEPRYTRIDPPVGSKRLVHNNDLVGIFSNGKLTLAPKYQHIGNFCDGLASFRESENGKVGFLNPEGRVIIPARFEFAFDFSEGLAAVGYPPIKGTDKSSLGFVDRKGQLIMTPKSGGNPAFSARYSPSEIQFHEGVCLIPYLSNPKDRFKINRFIFINRAGQRLNNVEILEGSAFIVGRALIRYYPKSRSCLSGIKAI